MIGNEVYKKWHGFSLVKNTGMSKSALFRFFKKHYHCTAVSYLNEYRVKQVAERLKTSNENLTLIAYEYGFESLSRFSHLFKKHMGVAPSDFRKQRRH